MFPHPIHVFFKFIVAHILIMHMWDCIFFSKNKIKSCLYIFNIRISRIYIRFSITQNNKTNCFKNRRSINFSFHKSWTYKKTPHIIVKFLKSLLSKKSKIVSHQVIYHLKFKIQWRDHRLSSSFLILYNSLNIQVNNLKWKIPITYWTYNNMLVSRLKTDRGNHGTRPTTDIKQPLSG